jgi:hypothetical protein
MQTLSTAARCSIESANDAQRQHCEQHWWASAAVGLGGWLWRRRLRISHLTQAQEVAASHQALLLLHCDPTLNHLPSVMSEIVVLLCARRDPFGIENLGPLGAADED